MATFHPFQRLPLELRIEIWELAFIKDRVLKIRIRYPSKTFWSPTLIPAVTRACQESRKRCSYQKAFIVDGSPRYIWANFTNDIIQMLGSTMCGLVEYRHVEMNAIQRLRIEMAIDNNERDDYEEEFFFHDYSHRIRDLPRLEGCDILVNDGLSAWTRLIEEVYWGACSQRNVRVVDAKTGEWIDMDTAGAYADWVDTNGGETRDYQRIIDDWDAEDEEEIRQREEAMMKMKEHLPRIDLGY
jgi:hypothetical protein